MLSALILLSVAALTLMAVSLLFDDVGDVPLIGEILEQKTAGSIGVRLSELRGGGWLPETPIEWLTGSGHPQHIEIAFIRLLQTVGLVGLALTLFWLGTVVQSVKTTPDREWVVAIVLTMLIASLFVPYLVIYPVGPLFFLAVGLTAAFHEARRSDRGGTDLSTLTGRA